jgi:hypothetical protein
MNRSIRTHAFANALTMQVRHGGDWPYFKGSWPLISVQLPQLKPIASIFTSHASPLSLLRAFKQPLMDHKF